MVRTAVERSYRGKPVGTTQRIIADMINFASDPMFAIDTNGIVLAWNDAMEQSDGRPALRDRREGRAPVHGALLRDETEDAPRPPLRDRRRIRARSTC